jgi:aminoglycoside/choline kinase family phosphotransferase
LPNEFSVAFSWVEQKLGPILLYTKVADTPYSKVFRISSNKGVFFLKILAQEFFSEAFVLDFLQRRMNCSAVPEIEAAHQELGFLLLRKCADEDLRVLFSEGFNESLFLKGLQGYQRVQMDSRPYVPDLLENGVNDWRLDQFPVLFDAIFEAKFFLHTIQIESDFDTDLKSQKEYFTSQVKLLEKLNLPPTLNHSDFHDNNMMLDHQTGTIKIIDWAEANIANPLLSHFCCLTNIEKRYGVKPSLEVEILEMWSLSSKDQALSLQAAKNLSHFYYLLTWKDLIEKTGYDFPHSVNKIKYALQVFSNSLKI